LLYAWGVKKMGGLRSERGDLLKWKRPLVRGGLLLQSKVQERVGD